MSEPLLNPRNENWEVIAQKISTPTGATGTTEYLTLNAANGVKINTLAGPSGSTNPALFYNTTTKEITYSTSPAPATPTLSAVMTAGNTASTTLNMNSNAISNITTATATTFVGALSGNATSATTATTSTNIAGGTASQIPYQSGASTTAFIANGTAGQVLTSNGTSAPTFAAVPVSADVFNNIVYFGTTTVTVANKLYYLETAGGWVLADYTNSIGKLLAIAVGTSSSVNGMYIASNTGNLVISVPSANIGDGLFVTSVAGEIGIQPAGSNTAIVRQIGYKISATEIKFFLYPVYIMPAGLGQYGIATGAGSTGFTSTTITDPISSFSYTLLRYTGTSGTNTMSVTTAGLFEIFVLGGGGGGGNNSNSGSGGGGGAGQLVKQTVYLGVDAYTMIVGAGGAVGIAGGGTSTRSAFRGGFSGIFPTTPNYPKIIAVGGGGGMASNAGGGGAAINSYARTTWACDSYCGGGGASPQTNSAEVTEYSAFSPTNVTSLNQIGFGDNTLTTGGFFGGTGFNNSNYSATGGGAGIGGAGGDYTQSGGQETMRGGAGGLGVFDTFTGASVGYCGGGCGGHATNQAIQTSLYGGGSGSSYNNGSVINATAGTANSGGGGGGAANQNFNTGSSAAGGSGLVMVRFRI